MYTNIFDTHAHYTAAAFDGDREELLRTLPERGVSHVLLAACDLQDTADCAALADRYPYMYTSAGIHPENLEDLPEDWLERLAALCKGKKVRAIGEIGLDRHYEGFNAQLQETVFCRQLELAEAMRLPVIVHIRDAMGDALEILKRYRPRGVVHCYSGSAETAREILRLGMHVSFTGLLTFKNARRAAEALAAVPDGRFMLETDCPYMAPVPYRGKRCDSAMIAATAERAAEIRGCGVQSLIDACTETGCQLFGL